LLDLITQEHFVRYVKSGGGVFNGLLITQSKNPILLKCIMQIVENVKNNYYGSNPLEPTGSLLLKQFVLPEIINNLPLRMSDNDIEILFNDKPILEYNFTKYVSIKYLYSGYAYNYITLWHIKQIYEVSKSIQRVIPLNIYQSWHTKDLSPNLLEATNSIITKNPEFLYHLYDVYNCYDFIKQNFNNEVYETYVNLIPYNYKMDLWKYCILYINGGVYIDMGFYNTPEFSLLELTDQEYFVKDLESLGGGIYNGFMVVKPRNQILWNCILKIVENVKNKRYFSNPYAFTGPLLMKECFTPEELTNLTMTITKNDSSSVEITYNNNVILQRNK